LGADCAFRFAVVQTGLVYLGVLSAQTINGRGRIANAPTTAGVLLVMFGSRMPDAFQGDVRRDTSFDASGMR
jgi:hypothetical protein